MEDKYAQSFTAKFALWAEKNKIAADIILKYFMDRLKEIGVEVNDLDGKIGVILLVAVSYKEACNAFIKSNPEVLEIEDLEEKAYQGMVNAIESGSFIDDFMDFLETLPDSIYQICAKSLEEMANK